MNKIICLLLFALSSHLLCAQLSLEWSTELDLPYKWSKILSADDTIVIHNREKVGPLGSTTYHKHLMHFDDAGGLLADILLDEALTNGDSYMAASAQSGCWWLHNANGDEAVISLVRSDGSIVHSHAYVRSWNDVHALSESTAYFTSRDDSGIHILQMSEAGRVDTLDLKPGGVHTHLTMEIDEQQGGMYLMTAGAVTLYENDTVTTWALDDIHGGNSSTVYEKKGDNLYRLSWRGFDPGYRLSRFDDTQNTLSIDYTESSHAYADFDLFIELEDEGGYLVGGLDEFAASHSIASYMYRYDEDDALVWNTTGAQSMREAFIMEGWVLVVGQRELTLHDYEDGSILWQKAYEHPVMIDDVEVDTASMACLLYTSPSPRDATLSRMPSSA